MPPDKPPPGTRRPGSSRLWEWTREQFDLDPSYVHLALSMLAPHPRPVRDAIEHHRRALDSNPALHFHQRDANVRRVLGKAAEYLRTAPDSIALTESTTAGLAVVYTGMRLKPGDEILSTEHEHYAASELLRFKAAASGADHRRIRLYEHAPGATGDEIITSITRELRESTRVLALTWVHSGTGVKIPIKRIGDVVSAANSIRPPERRIILCIDAVHALGVEDFEVEELGCDFLVAGCHKWLFGPRGTGIVWGGQEGWNAIDPTTTSFDVEVFWPWYLGRVPENEAPRARLCSPGGFPAYEHRWALAEAFDFHLAIGRKEIAARISDLNSYCREKLAEVNGVSVRTPADPELRSGMICFDVAGLDPADVVAALENAGIMAGQTPYRSSAVRFAPGVLNSADDIDAAVECLQATAGGRTCGRQDRSMNRGYR
ncbi:aminotransferase class V-fold PLP-dependent enzyme [Nocardiopsis sediminis]|uniref:Aminotransferase class V-fold PLP-dependent enzyme n=1 Tax=Nocardiopsis sediminis TaxID=1778267 RepID=A0ABV8FIR5_9ACTN